ncbi:NAD-dependent epimerase/dehydratase family protein [Gilvibacter sediminis]|uniref:NAD-dependent epimerase/dehydratase family protein n=1 Tax=Gilvibacter sediminis TaxID=379071 RepID=UPI0023505744|nr:NAD-dependent epimerase/dehydratase family protein [Gilvibacter sediminis]MDC7997212.1 NAD-dependent epimerase/dehydratase family protein [Gilvibacter sediminis]
MILVTGATGLVGSHLLCQLLEQQESVRALFRTEASKTQVLELLENNPKAKAQQHQLEWVQADLLDLIALQKACKGISHIYHCAAYISFDPRQRKTLRKINIEGTANLVNVALAEGVKSLCHISSVATLGTPLGNHPTTEKTEWNPQQPGSGYAISKYGAEMEVWRGGQEGLQVSMVLPAVILGEGHWNSASGSIIKRAAKGIPFYTPGGSGFVDVKDVVRASILVANDPKANGQKYLLVAENLRYKEFFGLLGSRLGKKPPKRVVPKFVMYVLAFLDGLKSRLLGTEQKLSYALIPSLYSVSNYSNEKIKSELDFTFTPIEQSLDRICAAFNAENRP